MLSNDGVQAFSTNTCFTCYCILENIECNIIYIEMLSVDKDPDLLIGVLFVQSGD